MILVFSSMEQQLGISARICKLSGWRSVVVVEGGHIEW